MKKLVCEMCGSSDLLKKDGVFECQSCGTKYSVEEAKKMMVEGVVQVEGTVKIDSSSRTNNLIKNGITLYNDGKYDEAYQLFGEVLNNDPDNYIAIIYRGFCQCWESSVAKANVMDMFKGITRGFEIAKEKLGETEKYRDLCMDSISSVFDVSMALMRMYNNYYDSAMKRSIEGLKRLNEYMSNSGTYTDLSYVHRENARYDSQAKEAEALATSGYKLVLLASGTLFNKILDVKDKEMFKVSDYRKIKELSNNLVLKGIEFSSNKLEDDSLTLLLAAHKCDEQIETIGKKRKEEYWKEHKEEKKELESKISEVEEKLKERNNKIEALKKEIDKANEEENNAVLPSQPEMDKLNEDLKKLKAEKSSIGIFKLKERKAVQEKIDAVNNKITKLSSVLQKEQDEISKKYGAIVRKSYDEIEEIKKDINKLNAVKEKAENELNRDID